MTLPYDVNRTTSGVYWLSYRNDLNVIAENIHDENVANNLAAAPVLQEACESALKYIHYYNNGADHTQKLERVLAYAYSLSLGKKP